MIYTARTSYKYGTQHTSELNEIERHSSEELGRQILGKVNESSGNSLTHSPRRQWTSQKFDFKCFEVLIIVSQFNPFQVNSNDSKAIESPTMYSKDIPVEFEATERKY